MSLLVLLAALLQALLPSAPTRVYFVGNSLTFTNDLPAMVAELGRSLDPPLEVEVGMAARDGMTLERHWQEGDVLRRLREGNWDILVLQEQSSRALTHPALLEQYLRRFTREARASGADMILVQTWARAGDEKAEPRLRENFREITGTVGVRLAPVGEAWRTARLELPAVVLYAEDSLHPSRAGTYLSAAVLLGMLGSRPLEDARTLDSGDPDSAAALRAVAWRALKGLGGRRD